MSASKRTDMHHYYKIIKCANFKHLATQLFIIIVQIFTLMMFFLGLFSVFLTTLDVSIHSRRNKIHLVITLTFFTSVLSIELNTGHYMSVYTSVFTFRLSCCKTCFGFQLCAATVQPACTTASSVVYCVNCSSLQVN